MTYLPVALTIARVTLVGGAGIMARFKVIYSEVSMEWLSGENVLSLKIPGVFS